MGHINIIHNQNGEELSQQAATAITNLFQKYKTLPILFLFSSGSALPLLDKVDSNSIPKNITIAPLDERFSIDPKINNFNQFMETNFYQKLQNRVTFIDTRVQKHESLGTLTQRYETALKNWCRQYPNGIIIATQGIGPDGHTSGIIPFPENKKLFEKLFEQPEKWVVGYDAKKKNPYPLRMTSTIPFLKRINHTIVYVTGSNKKDALTHALDKNVQLHQTPAAIIQQMQDVKLFTDLSLED